jgi:hypothetical protein
VRIYADFNALIEDGRVHLDRFGTLRALCAARLRLRDGLQLTLFMDSDVNQQIEVDATVRWIANPAAAEGGYWAGEFDPAAFRDVPALTGESVTTWFPCSGCSANLATQIETSGLSSTTCCSACGVPVHAPILPPSDGV